VAVSLGYPITVAFGIHQRVEGKQLVLHEVLPMSSPPGR